MGEFQKQLLPAAPEYIEQQGLKVVGRGKWVTTECRIHGGSDSMRWNLHSGGWVCMACGAKGGDVLAHHMAWCGLSFLDAAKELGAWIEGGKPTQRTARAAPAAPVREESTLRTTLAETGHQMWKHALPLEGTDGERYLRARRCVLPPLDGHLRYHPRLRHPSGYQGGALLALVTDAQTRKAKTLHRTWIRPDGTKADVDPPRLVLGGHAKQGGVIRLWPDEFVTMGLGIAEGIETALSLAHAYAPVWACIDAGNLGKLPVLAGIEALLIGADNDPAGARAANECAERWHAAGVEVRITRQQQNDLNDVLKEAA